MSMSSPIGHFCTKSTITVDQPGTVFLPCGEGMLDQFEAMGEEEGYGGDDIDGSFVEGAGTPSCHMQDLLGGHLVMICGFSLDGWS